MKYVILIFLLKTTMGNCSSLCDSLTPIAYKGTSPEYQNFIKHCRLSNKLDTLIYFEQIRFLDFGFKDIPFLTDSFLIKCTNVIEVDIAIGAEPKYIENYSIYIDRLTKLTKLKKLRLGDYLKKLPNNIYKLDSLESLTISTKELTPELSRLKYLKKNILYPTFKIF